MQAEPPTATPIELFTCDYLDGRDRGDLDRVIKRFNAWSDENESTGYSAWLLTPNMVHADIKFDVAWLGAWRDFATMGAGMDTWAAKGAGIAAEFDKVIDCDSHTMHMSYTIRPPENDTPPGDGVVFFASCKAEEGTQPMDVYNAHVKWEEWLKEKGANTSAWAFVPDLGTGDPELDYFFVRGFNNYSDMSATGQVIFNGGGGQVADEMLGGVTDCDNARVYGAELVRSGAEGQ